MKTEQEICKIIEAEGVFCHVHATPNGYTGSRIVNRLVGEKLVPVSSRKRELIITHDQAKLQYHE